MMLDEFDPEREASRVTLDCTLALVAESCARHAAFGAGAAMEHLATALYLSKMEQRLAEIERDVRNAAAKRWAKKGGEK